MIASQKPTKGAAYQRHVIQHDWAKQTADEQRQWHQRNAKVTPQELDSYVLGVEAGFRNAIATLVMHGLIDTSKVSGCEQ